MEYEDTNILRTQYVDDLVNQRQALEDALRTQNVEVEVGEGLETMIPKTELIEGTPVLPYYCFADGLVDVVNPIVRNTNFTAQKSLYGCFSGISDTYKNLGSYEYEVVPLDLSTLNTVNAENLEGMLAGVYDFKLGKYFNLTNATSLRKFVAGDLYRSVYNSSGRCFRDVDDVPAQKASKVTDISYFFAGGHKETRICPDLMKFAKDFFGKITFDNPELNASAMFNALRINANNYTDEQVQEMLECFKVLANSIKSSTTYSSMFNGSSDSFFLLAAPLLEYNNVKTLENFAYRMSGDASYYARLHNYTLDLSDRVFSKLETVHYMFYDSFASNSQSYTILMGTAPNETLTTLGSAFSGCRAITTLDISGWNLGKVNTLNSAFYGTSRLETLRFGYNLGKCYGEYKTTTSTGLSLNLTACTKLTYDSLKDVLGKVYDLNIAYNVANGGKLYSQTLNLGSTNLAKLTSEDIAIATNKGWTVK